MNKIYTRLSAVAALSSMMVVTSVGFSQNEKGFDLVSQNENSTAISFENPNFIQMDVDVNGQLMSGISTAEGAHNLTAGMPDLPHYSQSIVIPNEGSTTLEVTYSNYYDIQNVEIAPSKGNLYRNVNPADVAYTFAAVYNQDAFYPGVLADLSSPYILRDYRAQTVNTYPFQYNPVTKTLRVYENIQVSVNNNPNQIGENELTTVPRPIKTFEAIYAHQFLNYDDLLPQYKYTAVEEDGSCLVIGPASLQSGIDQLVEWKNRLGTPTEHVDIATIGNTDTQIKAYIEDYYANNPDLVFVIFVGDHSQVKCHTYGSSGGEQLWSDSYYGQMTGDYYPELFVGRLSTSNPSELQTMIDRQVEYETEPLHGDHWSRAIGLASDEGQGYGDDGEADWQHARNIRTELMNFGFTEVHEFYDGSHGGADANGDPSSTSITNAVNDGVTLFNYTGHGAQQVCVTGNFQSSHINSASNNGKYPFVISVACNNGTFTSGTCISESWIRASNGSGPTGAIAACGSTILMSWAPPMETQDEMSKIISEQYAGNKKVTLGGLFFNSMMSTIDDYGSSGIEVMQTWVFFGDPSVMFRSDAPVDMAVNHFGWVPLGETSLNVNCDVDDADITVTQAGEIIGTGVASGGSCLITFDNALTTDDYLVVTATKYNYDAYVGSVQVGEGAVSIEEQTDFGLSVFPNPASNNTFVSLNLIESAPVSLSVTDLSGKVVMQIMNTELAAGTQQFEVSTANLQAGVYFIQLNVNDKIAVEKLTVIK